ncbi:MAG: class I SAM-dependent methyltransferase [Vicinamibacterales bacterium]
MPIRLDPEGEELTVLETLLPRLGGRHVLEIGCGDGRLTRRYSARAASVVAIDPDASAVAALRADPPPGRVESRVTSFDDLRLADASFDVVLLAWSL